MDQHSFVLTSYQIEPNIKILENALVFLNSIKNVEQYFITEKAEEAFCYITNLTGTNFYAQSASPWDVFIKYNFHGISANVVNYVADECENILPYGTPGNTEKQNHQVNILKYIQWTLNHLVSGSLTFRIEVLSKGVVSKAF